MERLDLVPLAQLQADIKKDGQLWLGCCGMAVLHKMVNFFCVIFTEKRRQQQEEQGRLERVLANCAATDEYIESIKRSASENEARIRALDNSVREALVALSDAAANEISTMADEGLESDDDEELLTNFVNQKRRERRRVGSARVSTRQTMEAERLTAALDDVELWQSKLTLKRIDTIRSLSNPPQLVKLVADMVMLVLKQPLNNDVSRRRGAAVFASNWDTTIVHLQNPVMLTRLQQFHPDTVDHETVELLDVFLQLPNLTLASVKRASKDAYVLLQWILTLLEYHRVRCMLSGDTKYISQSIVVTHTADGRKQIAMKSETTPGGLLTITEGDGAEDETTSQEPSAPADAVGGNGEDREVLPKRPSSKKRHRKTEEADATGLDIILSSVTVNDLQRRYDELGMLCACWAEGTRWGGGMCMCMCMCMCMWLCPFCRSSCDGDADLPRFHFVDLIPSFVFPLCFTFYLLVSEKQHCEETAKLLEKRLQAANKRRKSFTTHLPKFVPFNAQSLSAQIASA